MIENQKTRPELLSKCNGQKNKVKIKTHARSRNY